VIVSKLTSGSGVRFCELAVVVGGSPETETDPRETAASVDLAEMGAILNGFGGIAKLVVGNKKSDLCCVGMMIGVKEKAQRRRLAYMLRERTENQRISKR
jgi:hypothetical protein